MSKEILIKKIINPAS